MINCRAEPLVEHQGDKRLLYMLRFNLAVIFCQLGRYSEAAKLVQQVRDLATERGDETCWAMHGGNSRYGKWDTPLLWLSWRKPRCCWKRAGQQRSEPSL